MDDRNRNLSRVVKEIFEQQLNVCVDEKSCWFFSLLFLISWFGFSFGLLTEMIDETGGLHEIRCIIPELESTNWSFHQIKEITQTVGIDCSYYNFNYNIIAKMTFEEAKEYTNERKNITKTVSCGNNFILKSLFSKTVREEFHIGCNNDATKVHFLIPACFSLVFLATMSICGDIYGRKRVINWSNNLIMLGSFVINVASNIFSYSFGVGLIQSGFLVMHVAITSISTEFVEIMQPTTRKAVFILAFYGFAFGKLIGSLIIVQNLHWKYIQMFLCIPLLVIPLIAWYVPESPRLYLANNKKKKTWEMLTTIRDAAEQNDLLYLYRNENLNFKKKLKNICSEFKRFFATKQSYFICYLLFVATLGYLNSDRWKQTSQTNFIERLIDIFSKTSGIFVCLPLILLFKKKIYVLYILLCCTILQAMVPFFNYFTTSKILVFLDKTTSAQFLVLTMLHATEAVPTIIRSSFNGISRGILHLISELFILSVSSYITPAVLSIVLIITNSFAIIWILFFDMNSDEITENTDEFLKMN